MKIKSIVAAITLMALPVFADGAFQYLYWMVDISGMEDKEQYAFSYATVSAGGTTFNLYDNDGNAVGTKFGNDEESGLGYTAGNDDTAIYAGNVSDYAGSTFLFELFNDENQKVGWSNVSGSSLASYIGGTMSQISSPFILTSVIPEPTSGLLLLFGLAGLALKRKHA